MSRRLRQSLTFENVLVTVVAFVVLAGGTAFAANQLAKNSVGKKQLKANAVVTAKIKKNAVTKAKIRNGAVDGSKVLDGSLSNADLNLAEVPFGRVVHVAHAPGPLTVSTGAPAPAPMQLDSPTYTQEAGRDDSILGAVDLAFDAECKSPRIAVAFVLLDDPNSTELKEETIVAAGEYIDETGAGPASYRVNIGSSGAAGPAGDIQPSAAKNHTLSLIGFGSCDTATGSITLSNAVLNVIGVK